MQATIGQRIYYVCVMKLSAIPKMFTFTDWIEFTAEDREQRVLNKKRIPDSQDMLLQKGRRLLDVCGFREVRLEILLEDGTVKNP